MSESDCVFCRIAAGEAEASVVCEDELSISIMTNGPVNPGHVLVLPKEHYAGLEDTPEAIAAHCFTVSQRVAAALRTSALRCEGVNLFLADGEAAFQEVMHFHLHVFPRFRGDSFQINADWSVRPDRSELNRTAELLRAAMAPNDARGL